MIKLTPHNHPVILLLYVIRS